MKIVKSRIFRARKCKRMQDFQGKKKMLDFVVMHEKGRCVRCDALCPWG
jgi:hypothetical protein